MENSERVLVCYHSPCLDGFASAWVVGHRFGFDNVEFIGVKYGDPVPDMTDREVYIVDFSYPPEVLIPAAKTAKKIVVLDHHETARQQWRSITHPDKPEVRLYRNGMIKQWSEPHQSLLPVITYSELPDNLEVIFSDSKAGVGTTWDRLFLEQDFPIVLNAIDCGDRFKMGEFERVRDVCEYCRAQGFLRASPANFTKFTNLIEETDSHDTMWSNYETIADQGAFIATAYDNLLAEFVPFDKPNLIEFVGYTVPCHAVPDFFKSSVGARFGKQYPFSITYDDNLVPGHRKFSLRSDQETGVDVEMIAKQFGGGGHQHAAGFTVPFTIRTLDSSVRSMLANRWVELIVPKLSPDANQFK
jgi:hypothetical protein